MAKPTFQQRFGFTPGKLILVVLLGAIFVGVIYYQFADQFSTAKAPETAIKQTPSTKTKADASNRRTTDASNRRTTDASNRRKNASSNPTTTTKSGTTIESRTTKPGSVRSKTTRVGSMKQPPLDTNALVAAVQFSEIRQWPIVDLATAIAHDPFEMPVDLKQIAIFDESRASESSGINTVEDLAKRKADADRELALLKKQKASDRALELAQARADFEAMVEAEQKRIKAAIEKIQDSGIPIVMVTGSTRVVQIGKKVYEVNDTFDGIRVKHIDDEGRVVLEQAELPPTFVPPPELLEDASSEAESDDNDTELDRQ